MDNEKVEMAEREKVLKAQQDELHASKCFVENLNVLFDFLFDSEGLKQGSCLLEIGKEAEQIKNE